MFFNTLNTPLKQDLICIMAAVRALHALNARYLIPRGYIIVPFLPFNISTA